MKRTLSLLLIVLVVVQIASVSAQNPPGSFNCSTFTVDERPDMGEQTECQYPGGGNVYFDPEDFYTPGIGSNFCEPTGAAQNVIYQYNGATYHLDYKYWNCGRIGIGGGTLPTAPAPQYPTFIGFGDAGGSESLAPAVPSVVVPTQTLARVPTCSGWRMLDDYQINVSEESITITTPVGQRFSAHIPSLPFSSPDGNVKINKLASGLLQINIRGIKPGKELVYVFDKRWVCSPIYTQVFDVE